MTVETQQSIVRYTGNSITTEFPVPFPVLEPGHLRLFTWDGRRQTEITEGWTVLGAGTLAAVVVMNAPPAQGLTLTILRRMPLVQMMDLLNGGPFNAETLESSADNLQMQIQQLAEELGRAIVAPESMGENKVTYETMTGLRDNAEVAADRAQIASNRAETARTEAQAAKTQARASATRAKNSAIRAEKAADSLPNIEDAAPGQVLTAVEQEDGGLKLKYADGGGGGDASNIPSGGIIMWSGSADNIPDGWALCDGTNRTPDLRNRMIIGAGDTYAPGDTGGANEHAHTQGNTGNTTLTEAQMPWHVHTFNGGNGNHLVARGMAAGGNGVVSASGEPNISNWQYIQMNYTGSSQGHAHSNQNTNNASNLPPYYALAFIMKL